MNKPCKNKLTSISCQYHTVEKINKTRYDDSRKPMKQTSFTVKNLGGNLPEKQFTIVKRSFRSNTKLLSLDSTIPVDELTTETFYRFRTSELFNIWMPPFLYGSQYVTNQWCTTPSTWHTNLKKIVGCKVLHFINNEGQEVLGYKTLKSKDVVASSKENKASITFYICSPCILLCDGL